MEFDGIHGFSMVFHGKIVLKSHEIISNPLNINGSPQSCHIIIERQPSRSGRTLIENNVHQVYFLQNNRSTGILFTAYQNTDFSFAECSLWLQTRNILLVNCKKLKTDGKFFLIPYLILCIYSLLLKYNLNLRFVFFVFFML